MKSHITDNLLFVQQIVHCSASLALHESNPQVTRGFRLHRANNAENVSMPYWRHAVWDTAYKPHVTRTWDTFPIQRPSSHAWIPIIKIRRSWDRLIFIMWIPALVRWHLYTETAHRDMHSSNSFKGNREKYHKISRAVQTTYKIFQVYRAAKGYWQEQCWLSSSRGYHTLNKQIGWNRLN